MHAHSPYGHPFAYPPERSTSRVEPNDIFDLTVLALVRLAWAVCKLVARHPVLAASVVTVSLLVHVHGWVPVVSVLSWLGIALVVWRFAHRRSFTWAVGRHARRAWREAWCYRRHWQPAMTLCGLDAWWVGEQHLPRLKRVRCSSHADHVLVRLLKGQSPHDFETQADALAHSLGARSCRVRVDRPGRVWLDFVHSDALADVVPALPVPDVVNLSAVPLGRTEVGQSWTLPLLGNHVLVGGATGAGKGSVFWSLLRGLAPAVRDGSVQVWALDPKGGMELGPGVPLFARFADEDPAAMADLLEDAVALMDARAARLKGTTRLHSPTSGDPLVVVLVDEMASLTAYLTDRDTKKRIAQALSLLLSKGRAVGVLVVAALQDPRKDVLPFRDLFPVRIALRLPEREAVDMVLGHHAHDRGAHCDRIPKTTPGVGYVLFEGDREPTRVRASWICDDDIRALATDYAPTRGKAHGAAA